ncbi:tyrosine-type recombinase/integrase [Novosphingobium lindaniclasticum]|uniref:Tyr recombinase domain-containing protein n=1 Tax=Novosphingobium lindaniclasticum LE124 TaxID=1096930 RepID=T0HT76_9SPHN|nr:site-specific integrase [Novosphingobium lindaniclasticum]EQB19581.1 hypothetical protein L284_01330 [Novosphingobium lindaniclasticum LE124]
MPIYPDRKNGKLTGRFRVEVSLAGTRKRGRANTMREARALEASLLRQLEGKEEPSTAPAKEGARKPSPMTVRDGITRAHGILWAGQTTATLSYTKLERIARIVGEKLYLDAFDLNTVDLLVKTLREESLSDATINRYISCLSAFLRFCKRRGFRTVDLPELEWNDEEENRIRWITRKEEVQLCKLLPSPFDALVYIAIRTGLRATELLTLQPDQVTPGWVHLHKTKNGHPRSVPLSKEVYEHLAPLVTQSLMPDYWQLRGQWDKARRAMGLADDPTFVFHACRHSYATRAIQADVNIRVLQQLMGHRTIQTTLRYAHIEDKTLAEAVKKMTAYHDGGMPPKGGVNGLNLPLTRKAPREINRFRTVIWRNGVPPQGDCKSLHAGSIPARASTLFSQDD